MYSMSTKSIIVAAVIIIVLVVGGFFIMQSSGSPMGAAANGAQQQAQSGATAATSSENTVQAQDITVGTGSQATPGMTVSVLYAGKLQDGTIFDSSAAHGNQPLTFTLGTQGLIPGFQIGVNGMKEGGERVMIVPPSLGYGNQDVKDPAGKVIIPANSPLIFDVKLVKVSETPATSTAPAAKPKTK
jgi:FKBP-type peptidyl-prolyl cis-trans isomerase